MPGFEWLGEEEKKAVAEVMDRGVLFRYEFGNERQGAYRVREFEQAFAEFAGARYALAVTSGFGGLEGGPGLFGRGSGGRGAYPGFHLRGHLGVHFRRGRGAGVLRGGREPVHGPG